MKKSIFFLCALLIVSCGLPADQESNQYEFMGCRWLIDPEYKFVAGNFQRDPQSLGDVFKAITFLPEPFLDTEFEHQSFQDAGGYMELVESFKLNGFNIGLYHIETERTLIGVEIKSKHRWIHVIKDQSMASFFNIELDEFKKIASECINFPKDWAN